MNMIGTRIKMAMGDTGTTEKQLCDEAGISRVILRKYIDGDRIPHAPIIVKMARVMGVDERWLAGVDDE